MPHDVELTGSPIVIEPATTFNAAAVMPSCDAEYVEVKRLAAFGAELALFVTHSRTGALKPHVTPYLQALQAEGVATLLIVVADRPVSLHVETLEAVAGAIVRRNSGYDFGAWSHALRIYPQVYGAAAVYLINDSMFGPSTAAAFAQMMKRIRRIDADLIGLTENLEYCWHLQSYFLVLRPRLLASEALRAFLDGVAPLDDKDDLIRAYELRMAALMQEAGFRVEAVFSCAAAGNSTLKAWRTLLKRGFPFVKVHLVAEMYPHIDTQGWRDVLERTGFDLDIVDATLRMGQEEVPLEDSGRLLAHPAPVAPTEVLAARLGYVGPYHAPGSAGEAARGLVVKLRALGAAINLLPVAVSSESDRGVGPDIAVNDFSGSVDIVFVEVAAVLSARPDKSRERVVTGARSRVGLLDGVTDSAVRARIIQGDVFTELWTSQPAWIEEALRVGGTPVQLLPELASTSATDLSRAIDSVQNGMGERINYLLQRLPERTPTRQPFDFSGYVALEHTDFGGPVGLVRLCANGAAPAPGETPTADWICLAPEGALLSPRLGQLLIQHALQRPHVAVFYGDDMAVQTEFPVDQFRLKPDFDITLLESQDYIGAPVLVRLDAWEMLGGLRPALETAAVADLIFRAYAAGFFVSRIPEVLLVHQGVRLRPLDNDYCRMLQTQPRLAEREIAPGRAAGAFSSRIRFKPGAAPAVTLVLPAVHEPQNGGSFEELLASVISEGWPADRLKVIVGGDSSALLARNGDPWPFAVRQIAVDAKGGDGDDAGLLNALWREVDTELLVFMDDRVLPSAPGWLEALLTYAVDPTVGAVAARLTHPGGRLQYAGLAPSSHGFTKLWNDRGEEGGTYQDWSIVAREWSMAGGAVLATRRILLSQVGGFDPRLTTALGRADLTLRMRSMGYRIPHQPAAEFISREATGKPPTPACGLALFQSRWRSWLNQDPSWHPRLKHGRAEMQPTGDLAQRL